MNNFMVQPVDTVSSRGTQGAERTGQNPFAGAVSGGIEAFPTESMAYLNNVQTGSVYKNGLGHSDFGKMRPFLA